MPAISPFGLLVQTFLPQAVYASGPSGSPPIAWPTEISPALAALGKSLQRLSSNKRDSRHMNVL